MDFKNRQSLPRANTLRPGRLTCVPMRFFHTGQIFYRQRFYSWKYNEQHGLLEIFNTDFELVTQIVMNAQLLRKREQVMAKALEALQHKDATPQYSINYHAFNDTRYTTED